ncbi:MAG TPA: hypothetical protein VHC97_27970 [Thermoanaerobaculia bacterium]|jgi:hypothetical protein|nr:hypothetical protein [Thermoanaerobaculia bacterium]
MMKTCCLALLITLTAAASFGQTPPTKDGLAIALEAIFSPTPEPATTAEPAVDLATVRRERFGTKDLCSAAARCDPYPSISCSSSVTGATCQGVDRNCSAGQQGFVRCNTSYTYCPPCSVCPEGAYRYVATGNCCDTFKEQREQQCVNGTWVNTGFYDCFGRCGPITP